MIETALTRRDLIALLPTAALGAAGGVTPAIGATPLSNCTVDTKWLSTPAARYQTFQRGRYSVREQQLLDLALGALQVAPFARPLPARDMLAFNRTWIPDNALYNDERHAASGPWKSIIAFAPFAEPVTQFPVLPSDFGDLFYGANDGGDFELLQPVKMGDTLLRRTGAQSIVDITEDGSDLRGFALEAHGELYNHRQELIARGVVRGRNGFRSFADSKDRDRIGPDFVNLDWINYVWPMHKTTDAEWERIISHWRTERVRGAEVLRWEDVKVGDELWSTISAPMTYMDMMRLHASDIVGQPTLREVLLKPQRGPFDSIVRGAHGMRYAGAPWHFGGLGFPGNPLIFFNHTARNLILRMVTNWAGDAAMLRKYSWRFMKMFREMRRDKTGGEFLQEVASMRGRGCERHPVEGDAVISKGQVVRKYRVGDERLLDATCWGETLDGEIVAIVPVTLRLT